MLNVKSLYYLVLLGVLSTMAACQKDKQQLTLPEDQLLSISEKVTVPVTGNLSISEFARETKRDYNTFYGPVVQMGDGHARSWINITRTDNLPLAIGVEVTAGSLQNLTTDPLAFAASTFFLKLHQKALAVTPFDHITLNWEPQGHDPIHVYGVPHFDFHFYKITIEEQLAITGVPGPAPAPGYLPSAYVIRGGTVPQMGTHWLNPASPELHPPFAPFTHTLIYGSNNGDVSFLEPMITRDFLLSGNSVDLPYPQPALFAPSETYYPTRYSIWTNSENGRIYVALTNFVLR